MTLDGKPLLACPNKNVRRIVPGRHQIVGKRKGYLTRTVEIVVPSISVLAEPPVTVVDKVALRKGTRDVADSYLKYLYSPEGQEIIARHFYRPRDPRVAARYAKVFPQLTLVTIDDFGGWAKVQATHFGEGGVFDQIYVPQ